MANRRMEKTKSDRVPRCQRCFDTMMSVARCLLRQPFHALAVYREDAACVWVKVQRLNLIDDGRAVSAWVDGSAVLSHSDHLLLIPPGSQPVVSVISSSSF